MVFPPGFFSVNQLNIKSTYRFECLTNKKNYRADARLPLEFMSKNMKALFIKTEFLKYQSIQSKGYVRIMSGLNSSIQRYFHILRYKWRFDLLNFWKHICKARYVAHTPFWNYIPPHPSRASHQRDERQGMNLHS